MKTFSFSKFSPSGNDTLFLNAPKSLNAAEICRKALDIIPAEQAGLADLERKHVQMAGGEFCLNACRSFGAMLNHRFNGGSCWQVTISGYPKPLDIYVSGKSPEWHVEVTLDPGPVRINELDDAVMVGMDGITHMLLWIQDLPKRELARLKAAEIARKFDLRSQKAYGVTWCKKTAEGFEILPFVEVPEAGTANFENSCGSASLALAMIQDLPRLAIKQPHGSSLQVTLVSGKITLGGPVRLLAEGKIWLEAATEGLP